MQYKLSIILPARCEEFLGRTIEDLLENTGVDTEIIAVLDGEWANPPIEDHDRVNLIYVSKAVGQRAATNLGVKLSRARWVMKMDAHCAFDKGFDTKMISAMEEAGDNVTMVSVMRNLWAYDFKCFKCGKKVYQDKIPTCPDCGTKMKKKMMWVGKHNPQSTSYCFDSEPKFKYFEDWKHRPQYVRNKKEKQLTETMSLQGSCFMCTREKWWELNICDEKLGSWGNQGVEVSLKTRLSGGRVLVNHNTWYAHMFRTKAIFGFPWPVSGREQLKTKKRVRDLFWNSSWSKQIYPVSKVVQEFWPVAGWVEKDLKDLKKHEMKTSRSGVYSIKSKTNGKVYVGSVKNLSQRFGEHLRRLRSGDHENMHLQSAWNKYGEDDFTFNVEYFCGLDELIKWEQRFIDKYKAELGWRQMYNLNPVANSNLGMKHRGKYY